MRGPLICAVLALLGAAACGGELNGGTSYHAPLDAGADAADAADAANPDPLARAAADMAGTWTTQFFETVLILTIIYIVCAKIPRCSNLAPLQAHKT